MSKPAKKPSPRNSSHIRHKHADAGTKKQQPAKPRELSKQGRIIELLRSTKGTTIEAMMKATGWQQHSVRGFLAGVVRKRLKLKLSSEVSDGRRIYRVTPPIAVSSSTSQPKQR